jgi:hypothetical protein
MYERIRRISSVTGCFMLFTTKTVPHGGDRRPIRTRNVAGSRGPVGIPASTRGLCRDSAPGKSRRATHWKGQRRAKRANPTN